MPKILYQRGKDAAGKRRVFVAVPTYSGSVGAAFTIGLFEAVQILDAAKIGVDVCIETGNCHVDDARNALVREFLKTDCTDMVFVDEDVGFDGADLYRLLIVDRPCVAGVYPCKQDETEFPVMTVPGVDLYADKDGLVEVEAVPTGFLRLRRDMIEEMIAHFGDRTFYGRGQENESPHTILFERTYEAGKRYSGDYSFCRKWKSIGGKIFVNPYFHFSHTGAHEWSGTLADYWLEKHGERERRIVDAITAISETARPGIEMFENLCEAWNNPVAAIPYMLMDVYYRVKESPGSVVLECGCGLTTIVILAAGGFVDAMENDAGWIEKVHYFCRLAELPRPNIQYAPIAQYDGYSWYDDSFSNRYRFVVCDGPARKYGRDGLFRRMGDLIKGAVIFVDDTNDPAQLALVETYCQAGYANMGRYCIGVVK